MQVNTSMSSAVTRKKMDVVINFQIPDALPVLCLSYSRVMMIASKCSKIILTALSTDSHLTDVPSGTCLATPSKRV